MRQRSLRGTTAGKEDGSGCNEGPATKDESLESYPAVFSGLGVTQSPLNPLWPVPLSLELSDEECRGQLRALGSVWTRAKWTSEQRSPWERSGARSQGWGLVNQPHLLCGCGEYVWVKEFPRT
ncbi:unnamed protein product [Arctogadus glacialis]